MQINTWPRRCRWLNYSFVFLIFCLGASPGNAASLWVQPTYPQKQTQEVYTPLVEYLARQGAFTLDLVTHPTFQHHWIALRSGVPADILIEDAHIADYLIQNLNYTPIAKAARATQYSLVVLESSPVTTLNDLIGLKVASLSSPSISYVMVLHWFEDPISAPELNSSLRSWNDGIEMLFSQEVDAAVIPSHLLERYPNLRAISQSRELPAMTVLVSSEVSEGQRELIKSALINLHNDADNYSVLHELDIQQFVEATREEYAGYQDTLTRMYGFVRTNSPLLNVIQR